MSANDVLIDIEDYDSAYYSRWDDFRVVSREPRKIMAMHLGGIVIECLLKGLIIKKYGIKKAKSNYWFDQSSVVALNALANPQNIEYRSRKTLENPSHNLLNALSLLSELQNTIPSDIESKLKLVFNPLRDPNGKSTYIELRYCNENHFTDDEFDEWLTAFRACIAWINNRKSTIVEVV